MKRLLVSDIDGTLVGDRAALARLHETLKNHPQRPILAYATGRTLGQCLEFFGDPLFPQPDIWVTQVGAAISYGPAEHDASWEALMGKRWHRETVVRLVSTWPELTPQPPEADGPFKVPFRIAPHDAAVVLPQLSRQLHEAGTPARLVYSSQRDLDIIPADAGKGPAVCYLAKRLGVNMDNILTCGDSANDRDMLCLGCPAVCVANAHAELTESGLPDTVLRARAGYAAGVLEALGHYGWL